MNDDDLDLIKQRLDRLEDRLDKIEPLTQEDFDNFVKDIWGKPKKEHKDYIDKHPITAILAIIIVVLVISSFW